MAKNIELMGAVFPDVPSILIPQHEGGLVSYVDVTDTTASASDVATGKYFYTAVGVKTEGTNSGGGGSVNIETLTKTNNIPSATSLKFTLKGEPKVFFLRLAATLTRVSSNYYYYITTMRYNGTNTYGNYWRMSSGQYTYDTSHYSFSYDSSTKELTLSSSASRSSAGGSFYNSDYELVYVY